METTTNIERDAANIAKAKAVGEALLALTVAGKVLWTRGGDGSLSYDKYTAGTVHNNFSIRSGYSIKDDYSLRYNGRLVLGRENRELAQKLFLAAQEQVRVRENQIESGDLDKALQYLAQQ